MLWLVKQSQNTILDLKLSLLNYFTNDLNNSLKVSAYVSNMTSGGGKGGAQ